jgi:Tol biopolymer transport system component
VSGGSLIASVKVLVGQHGGRVDWSPQNVIAFSKFTNGKSGGEIYTMNPDGSAQTCVTCGKSQLSHVSNDQPAWTPNGKYILFQSVDQALYDTLPLAGAARDRVVQGGAGVDNNLWVTTPNGASMTQLTHVGQSEAVLHPHFSYDGRKLFWAARVRNKGAAGAQWELAIADFVDDGAGPHLANERTFQPVGPQVFYEAHDFLPDNQSALFSTDANPTAAQHPTNCVCALNIEEINFATGQATALTSTTNVWNEHAQASPDGKKIVWISSQGYPFTPAANWQSTLKTDLWMMNADGSGKQQLTFFNTPGSAQYTGARVILSDGSWNTAGDKYVMQMDSIGNGGDASQVIELRFASPQ